jgi:hypothetical protein
LVPACRPALPPSALGYGRARHCTCRDVDESTSGGMSGSIGLRLSPFLTGEPATHAADRAHPVPRNGGPSPCRQIGRRTTQTVRLSPEGVAQPAGVANQFARVCNLGNDVPGVLRTREGHGEVDEVTKCLANQRRPSAPPRRRPRVGPKMGPKIRFQYRYRSDAPEADVSRHIALDLPKRVPVCRDKASGFGSFRGPGVPTDHKVRDSNPFGRALC